MMRQTYPHCGSSVRKEKMKNEKKKKKVLNFSRKRKNKG